MQENYRTKAPFIKKIAGKSMPWFIVGRRVENNEKLLYSIIVKIHTQQSLCKMYWNSLEYSLVGEDDHGSLYVEYTEKSNVFSAKESSHGLV